MSVVYKIIDPLTFRFDLVTDDLETARAVSTLTNVQAVYLGGQTVADQRLIKHQITFLDLNQELFVADREYTENGIVARKIVDLLHPSEVVYTEATYNLYDVNTNTYKTCQGIEAAQQMMIEIQTEKLRELSLHVYVVHTVESIIEALTPVPG